MKNNATPIGIITKAKDMNICSIRKHSYSKNKLTNNEMIGMPFLIQCTRLTAISTFYIF